MSRFFADQRERGGDGVRAATVQRHLIVNALAIRTQIGRCGDRAGTDEAKITFIETVALGYEMIGLRGAHAGQIVWQGLARLLLETRALLMRDLHEPS